MDGDKKADLAPANETDVGGFINTEIISKITPV